MQTVMLGKPQNVTAAQSVCKSRRFHLGHAKSQLWPGDDDDDGDDVVNDVGDDDVDVDESQRAQNRDTREALL